MVALAHSGRGPIESMEQAARCLGVGGAFQWEWAVWRDDSSRAEQKPFTNVAISSVAGKNRARSSETSRPVETERPKSPDSTLTT